MNIIKVTGVRSVLTRLKGARNFVDSKMEIGLKKGGLFLQQQSQEIVPVLTGNLKNSAFTRNVGGKGSDADIAVGYTANYAVFVHEDLNARHKPGKMAKYLEKPAREKRKEIIKIISREIK